MTDPAAHIVDITPQNFQAVLESSSEVPVVIDFWSTNCAPCRELTPILEKLVQEYAGRFILAKVNVDDIPQAASAFGISSIPFVVAFSGQQPVNQFQGLLPEEQVREWLDTFCPSKAFALVQEALALEPTDPAAAEAKLRAAVEAEPSERSARVHWARLLLALDRDVECREVIDKLAAEGYLEPQAESIKNQLDVIDQAEESGGVEEARSALAADPSNLELRLQLADALAVDRKFEDAFEICLAIVAEDKMGAGVSAKETMVKIFDLVGQQSDLVSRYRRKLATLLY